MKNILNKIEFHKAYLVMALGLVLTGHFSNLIVFTSLILVHEIGHIITACIFNYKIKKIIIYPYGGITKLDTLINTKIEKDLLVAVSGIIMQLVYFYIIFFLYSKGIIREYIYNLFIIYNNSILLFNMLPIIPLDGSKIINLILSKYINFNLSNNLTVFISLISLIFFLISNIYQNNYSMLMVIFILLQNIWNYYKKIDYLYNKFILERYLYKIKFKDIKIIKNKNKMYKNKFHLFKINNYLIDEKKYLKNFFDKKA